MKKIIAIIFAILLISDIGSFFLGVQIGIRGTEIRIQEEQNKKVNYTGQQIQDAVNSYRKEKGLRELKVNSLLCSDLATRYLAFQTSEALTEGHPGFDTWAKSKFKEGFNLIGEVFSPRPTVQEVLNGWKNSPGHNEALIDPRYTEVCTYAGVDGVVLVLGEL